MSNTCSDPRPLRYWWRSNLILLHSIFYSCLFTFWLCFCDYLLSWLLGLTNWGRDKIIAIVFKCIFLNENAWISVQIPLKSISKGPIYNSPSLVQIMACADQAIRHFPNQTWLVYRRKCGYLLLSDLRAQLITVINDSSACYYPRPELSTLRNINIHPAHTQWYGFVLWCLVSNAAAFLSFSAYLATWSDYRKVFH